MGKMEGTKESALVKHIKLKRVRDTTAAMSGGWIMWVQMTMCASAIQLGRIN